MTGLFKLKVPEWSHHAPVNTTTSGIHYWSPTTALSLSQGLDIMLLSVNLRRDLQGTFVRVKKLRLEHPTCHHLGKGLTKCAPSLQRATGLPFNNEGSEELMVIDE